MTYYPLYYQIDSGLNLAKAPVIMGSASGAIASFPDGAADLPVQSLQVGINPVQDLHGYDSPWPAGGGANILDPNIHFENQIVRGVSLTTSNGYKFATSGTGESGVGNFRTNTIPFGNRIVYPAGTYTIVGAVFGTYKTDGTWYSNRYGTFTAEEDFSIANGYIEITEGRTYNSNAFLAMVAGSVAPTSWTPYSNICPISGWTGVNVANAERYVKTQPNPPQKYTDKGVIWTAVKYPFITANGTATGGNSYSGAINGRAQDNTLDPGTYILKAIGNIDNVAIKFAVNEGNYQELNKDTPEITVTVNETSSLAWYCIVTNGVTVNAQFAFVIGRATLIPITFPSEAGTVYGGRLTINQDGTGKLVVDSAMIASYDGESLPGEWISDRDVYASGTTPTTGAQVVYKLATPITYQITAPQVRTLLGTNNIWADTGDTAVDYRADTKLYIEQLTKPAEDDMNANANIASGKFFMVGNRLFLSTAAIEQGAAIVPGTNCTELSLADALNALNT